MSSDQTVVYVEDDQANRALMASIFARHFPELRLDLARNGLEGLDVVTSASPRLILLDGYLGDMTASEFIIRLRPRMPSGLPPIVVVSGSMVPDSATKIEGVEAHVMKPFKIADLVNLLGPFLGFSTQ
jgi:CheY-like chemotaxis protein